MAGYRKTIRSSQKEAFRGLGKLGDEGARLSAYVPVGTYYQPQIEEAFKNMGTITGEIGQYTDPALSAAKTAAVDFLGGQDFGAGLKDYTSQIMDYVNKEVLPAATFNRMGRGSALSNALSRALSQTTGSILDTASDLASQKMGIAAQIAQFLPQQALEEQQAQIGGYGDLASGLAGYEGQRQGLASQNQMIANAIRQQEFANKQNALATLLGFGPVQSGFGSFLSGLGDVVGGVASGLGAYAGAMA